jgi:hypothetical protein
MRNDRQKVTVLLLVRIVIEMESHSNNWGGSNPRGRAQCTLRVSFLAARQLCPDRLGRIGGCPRRERSNFFGLRRQDAELLAPKS